MTGTKIFLLLICFGSYMFPSQCCISIGYNGCSLMSFGGRLIIDESMNLNGDNQLLLGNRRQILIFQPPPGTNKRWGLLQGQFSVSGRGVIWRSNGYCGGPHSQCGMTGSHPCLDTRRPCGPEPPSYSENRTDPLQFSDVTPSGITVTWPAWDEATDLGYGPITEYKIQIKEQEQTEFDEVSVGLGLSHRFENLTEYTEYEFRVVILRDHPTGEGPPSRIQTQRTPAEEPPSYSQNRTDPLHFSDVTPSSITVTWPAWDEAIDLGSGPIVEYKIQSKKQEQTEFNEVSEDLGLSHQLVNLTEDTEYEFRVVIVRDHPTGEGPPSRIQTKRTSVKEPPSYSETREDPLQFPDVTPSGITVTWPAWDEETDLGYGPIAEYKIQIKEQEQTEFDEVSVGLGLSHRFENLTEYTEYEFRVVIVRDHPTGEGPPSRIQIQRTPAEEPPSYSQTRMDPLQFSDVTPSSITVTWPAWDEAIDLGSGPIVEYRIQIKEQEQTEYNEVSVNLGLSHQFVNLTEDTEYEFRVVIVRDHPTGEGAPSRIQTKRTSVKEPPSYSETRNDPLQFSDATPNGITVTWPAWDEETDLGYGRIAEYKIQIKEQEHTEFDEVSMGLGLSHRFENLTEYTKYEFRVVIVRDHPTGEGPPSRIQTQRTPAEEPPSYSQNRKDPLQFSDVTPSSITVTWPAWDEAIDLGSGPIVEYKIQIKEQEQTEYNVSVGLVLSHQFVNLTEDTEYEFRVVIVRDHPTGEGPPSTIQTKRTLVKEHPSYSRNRTELLQFSDVTPTSITASWPAWHEATDLGSGPAVEYRIQIRKLGSNFNEVPVGLNLSHRFHNLTEDTEYEFRVVIVRDHPQGDGPPSRIQMQRTAAIEISTVQPVFNDSGVQIQTNGGTTGNFSNESTAGGQRPVNQYRHVYENEVTKPQLGCSLSYGGRLKFDGDVSSLGDQLLFGSGGRKRIFIFQEPPKVRGGGWGLPKYGSSGMGRIWIGNRHCKGPQSEQSLCPLTEERSCLDSKMPCDATPPSYSQEEPLQFSEVTDTSINVEWPAWDETTDLGFGPIEAYIIEFRETGVDSFQGIRKGLDLSHQFQSLTAGKTYEFRLVVVRDHPHGEGPPSRIQHQSTPSRVFFGDDDVEGHGSGPVFNITPGDIDLTDVVGPNGYNPVRNLMARRDGVGKMSLTWSSPELDPTLYVTVGYVVKYVLQKHIACLQNVDRAAEIHVNDTEVVLTDLEDYGIYEMYVTPRTRTVRRPVNVEVKGETVTINERTLSSGPVATLEPVNGKRSSATKLMFSWNQVTCENENGPDFTYNCVLYFMNGNSSERITEVNVTRQSHVFTNLKPCGRYRLEVTPQNKMNSGATETEEALTNSAPFGVVQDFSFTPNPEHNHFTVTWNPPRDTLCAITSYTLTTTLQKQQACSECVDEEASTTSDIQETSRLLDNLLPFATYMISITAHGNDVSTTGSTFEDVVTTSKRAPASFPNVMFDGVSSTQTSLTFTWDPVSCEDLNGAFIQYTYNLEQTDSEVIIEEDSIRDQFQSQITFTGLTACRNYTFKIRVDNDAFNGLFNTIYGTTKLTIPGNDTNLSLTPEISDTCTNNIKCLIATWQKPRSNSCPIAYQTISLHQIDDDNCRDTSSELISSFNISSTQLQQVFRELEHNSLYRATLVIANSAGSTEMTQELRTPEGVPTGAPTDVVLKRPIRGRKLNLTWDEPECGHRHGNIVGYNYKLKLGQREIKNGTTSNKWHYFQDLQRGRKYSFTVKAYTALGPGPEWRSESDELFYFRTRS